ncbi:MAG TPA: protease pro-enzyme activation domain-containing protein, partial [Ktedonobacteraceae bacterium]|nr:protease pro-enzyme activation domain-containing protein [Ktedonobacteraceae bacterium]
MKVRSLYPVIVVPLLCMIVVGTILWAYISYSRATANVPRGLLPDSVSSFTGKSKVIAQMSSDQQVSLAIGLNLRNQAALAAYLKEIYTPHSPIYHHYLNTQTFDALYAPLPSSEAALAAYLRTQGLTVSGTYADHLVVDARGSVAQVEQAFQVQLNNYAAPNGLRFYANANAPSLPVSLSPLVASVTGLDNAVQYSRIPLANGSAKPGFARKPGASGISCPQPGAATVPTSYTPPQIATAYNLNQLYANGNLGQGQSVALLELDGYSSNDIALYASCFGGNGVSIQTIPIDGYNEAAGSNAIEVELDMEMVLGLAPRLSALRVYEAANNLAAYNDAWARIIADRVPVVSTSWVFCEEGAGIANELQQENIFFQTAAAQGQTILSASGDLGANGCYNPQNGSGANPAVDDPASQPYVTGVGGTRLLINPDDSYQSEQVWNDRANSDGA